MKKRILTVLAILAVFGYMIFIGRSSYMFGWLAEQNFLYIWALIAIMVIAKQDVCAIWSTVGAVFAVFPAEIVAWVVTSLGCSAGTSFLGCSLRHLRYCIYTPKARKTTVTAIQIRTPMRSAPSLLPLRRTSQG